jgi:hypothetical protein
MAEVRAARSLETPRDAGLSKRVFRGNMFNATMLEEEALRIAQEMPANRRRMNHQQTVSLPVSVWMIQEISETEMDLEDLLNDFDFLDDKQIFFKC